MSRIYYTLTFPEDLKLERVVAFLNNLGGLPNYEKDRATSSVVFEVWSLKSGLKHRIGLPSGHPHLLDQLHTAIPGVRMEKDAGPLTRAFSYANEFALSSDKISLEIKEPAATATSLLTSLRPVNDPGEAVVLQFVITPTHKEAPQERKRIKPVIGSGRNGLWGSSARQVNFVASIFDERLEEKNQKELEWAKDKWQGYMFSGVCRLAVRAVSKEGADRMFTSAFNALEAATGQHVHFEPNSIKGMPNDKESIVKRLLEGEPPHRDWPCMFNTNELSALVAFPIDSPKVPGLKLSGEFQLPPDNDIPTEGIVIAASNYDDSKRPLAIPWSESIRHFYTAGKTGTGKTTLLENCLVSMMKHGNGLFYIDPIGDSAPKMLNYVPKNRVKDVVYFNPTDPDRVMGINLFENSTEHPDLTTDNIMGMLESFYKDSWGDRLAYHLRGAIRTLAAVPDSTFPDIARLFKSDRFREQILSYKHSSAIEDYWEDFDDLSKTRQLREETLAPIMNKLQPFNLRDDVRHVVSQVHPLFNFDDAMAANKIVIANMDGGKIGEGNASLLGSMLMVLAWKSAQRRPENDRKTPFYSVVDECQNFMNLPTGLDAVLSQGRHYGFGLFLANQYPHQLPETMRRAIVGNVGSFAYFRLTAEDAGLMAPQYGNDLKTESLTSLDNREVIVSISTGGDTRSRPTGGQTYPMGEPVNQAQAILANQKQYTLPRAEVEAAIEQRREALKKRADISSREVTDEQ